MADNRKGGKRQREGKRGKLEEWGRKREERR